MRGLDPKLQAMPIACIEFPFNRLVSKAITAEEKYRQKQESKKKKMPVGPFGRNVKHQKVIYHPQNHARYPQRPPQFQARPQAFARPIAALPYPRQQNVPAIHYQAPQSTNNNPNPNVCFNCGKPGHYSNVCPYPKQ